MRTDHIIRATRSDALPSQIVCVQASSQRRPAPGLKCGEVEELTGWCAVAWRHEGGRVVRQVERSGPDRASFWTEMDRVFRKGTLTWLFSYRAHRVMTLLGLWDKLLAKEVYLDGRDNRAPPGGRAGKMPDVRGGSAGANGGLERGPDGGLPGMRGKIPGGTADVGPPTQALRGGGVGFAITEDPPTVVQFRRRGRAGVAKWVDTRNYTHPDLSAVRTADGCLARTVSFVLGMVGCVREHGLGSLANTAAGQAWNGWRRSHYTHAVHVHCYDPALLLERQAYCGGRCECYRIGEVKPPVYHLDFRSHYLSCYADALLPVALKWYGEYRGGSADLSCLDPTCTIAEVLVSTDKADYPAVRRFNNGRTLQPLRPGEPYPEGRAGSLCVYPTGRFRVVLCGPELAHALARGRVARVFRAGRYDMAVALRGIGSALRGLRAAVEVSGCPDLLAWVKLMSVGLVGRLGMHGRKWVADPRADVREPYSSWWVPGPGGVPVRCRSLAWEGQREVVEPDAPETCPAMAGWICSIARVKLLEVFDAADTGERYYTDTDSIWTDQGGYQGVWASGMLGNGEPGLLRLIRVHDDVVFYGYKHYRADERYVCAGQPAEPVGGDVSPTGYRVRERCGNATKGRTAPQVRSVVRPFNRAGPYRHGTVLADGRVVPLELWED